MNMMVLLAGLLVAGMIGLVMFVMRGQGGAKAATRLDVLVGKKRQGDSQQELVLRNEMFEQDKNKLIEMITSRIPNLQLYFEQADANIKPSSLIMIGGILAGVGMTAAWVARIPVFLLPVSGSILFLIPFLWLWNKRRSRLSSFASQLSDALELIARALRAGHALAAGLHVVAEEMPAPISAEFGRVYEEQNLGITLEEAFEGMCRRVPNLDLRFFVTSVNIQRQTGGDLAEILDKISHLVRERYKIQGTVKALTAEGRLSGLVLIGLPFFLLVVMLHVKYDYVAALWQTEIGVKMSLFALLMQLIGAYAIKKIVDIKV